MTKDQAIKMLREALCKVVSTDPHLILEVFDVLKATAHPADIHEELMPYDRAIKSGRPQLFSYDCTGGRKSVRVIWPDGEGIDYIQEEELTLDETLVLLRKHGLKVSLVGLVDEEEPTPGQIRNAALEEAAKECDHWQSLSNTHKCGEYLAHAIRALKSCTDCGEKSPADIHTCSPQSKGKS